MAGDWRKRDRTLRRLRAALRSFIGHTQCGEMMTRKSQPSRASIPRYAPDFCIFLIVRRKNPLVPHIAIEVLAPGDTVTKLHSRLKSYFESGVKEAWIIDPVDLYAERWNRPSLPPPVIHALTSPLLPGFELLLSELFA